MKIYSTQNVFDAALTRIRWLYDEFPNIVCNVSGGKDSTVLFHLCLQVASEKGRLPLRVMWLDQEAEWQATVDMVRSMMYHPDVEPLWFQMPFRLFNATSSEEHWLHCWDPDRSADWVHPQDPVSMKVNRYGTDRFHKLFAAISATEFPDTPTCYLAGVRTEESPVRMMALTHDPTYKWATWGTVLQKRLAHYTMYPLYDWSYLDIWKAIGDHQWPYCRIYDAMYQYGVPVNKMRVSNVHHETAVHSLFFMQEVEPETYNRLTARISGIDSAVKFGDADYFVSDLPFMFATWREYRDYLVAHLIQNEDWRRSFQRRFDRFDLVFGDSLGTKMYRQQVHAILVNDWEGITLNNFFHGPEQWDVRLKRRRRTADTHAG